MAGSAILRIGFERWSRNLAVGLGNAPASPARARRAAIPRRRSLGAGARACRTGRCERHARIRILTRIANLIGYHVPPCACTSSSSISFREQDRLLLRVSTDNQLEVRLWLTRRALRLLWPLLVQMARASPEVALQSNPQARDALVGMQHERALRRAEFRRSLRGDAARDCRWAPSRYWWRTSRTSQDEQGNQVLALLPQQGQGIHLTLDNTLLHSLCKLLQNAVAKSDWDMALELPARGLLRGRRRVARTIN